MSGAAITVDRMDHFVLTVRDLDATVAFYSGVLGMTLQTFGPEGRKALAFGRQKINLHIAGHEFEPKARTALPGTADFCLIVQGPIDAVAAALTQAGVPIELGPTDKTGALGPMRSVYCRDPDGNLVELSVYPAA